jgi:TRAP transporter TAXI family solute receptor
LGRASSGLMDLVSSRKLNWIPIEKDAAPKILKVFPYYHIGRLNPGDYMLKNPVDMVVWTYQLFCQKNLPERVIYDLTKVTFEHLDEIHPVTADAKEIKLENQLKTMVIPPHPGAKKYFEEKGVKA